MRILVINPNTTQVMTDEIDKVAQAAAAPGTKVETVQPKAGPRSIEGSADEVLAAYHTLDLVAGMRTTTSLTPMAHLTCVVHSRLELAEILIELRKKGVENVLALGGDPPPEGEAGLAELIYASELVELAHAIGGFSIGVAAHPEVHPRSPDRATDRQHLAAKLSRADFAITQFFFRLDYYLTMVDELNELGVDKPIIPGIMPITSLASISRMAELSGAAVPPEVIARFEGFDDPADVRRIGIELATELCQKLLGAAVPGLHFYTLNLSTATRQNYENLGLVPA